MSFQEKYMSVINGILSGEVDFSKDLPSDGSLGLTSEQMKLVIDEFVQKSKGKKQEREVYIPKRLRGVPITIRLSTFVFLTKALRESKNEEVPKVSIQEAAAKEGLKLIEHVSYSAQEVLVVEKEDTIEGSQEVEQRKDCIEEVSKKEVENVKKDFSVKYSEEYREYESFCSFFDIVPQMHFFCVGNKRYNCSIEVKKGTLNIERQISGCDSLFQIMSEALILLISILKTKSREWYQKDEEVLEINDIKTLVCPSDVEMENKIEEKYNLGKAPSCFIYCDESIDYTVQVRYKLGPKSRYGNGEMWDDALLDLYESSEFDDYVEDYDDDDLVQSDRIKKVSIVKQKKLKYSYYEWLIFIDNGCYFIRSLSKDYGIINLLLLDEKKDRGKVLESGIVSKDVAADVLCCYYWELGG